jgi:DNA-binding NtrC family response regulator
LADGGTLFLDEIGEIVPVVQVKQLRALQEREFDPLGGTRSVKVDVRIVAATNKNLAREIKNKRFREDLYYRLNVIRITLPPLAERREDIPLLVEHFIHRFNAVQGKNIRGVDDLAMWALMAVDFPGNIRELENAIEHAFILCRGPVIEPTHLPTSIISAIGETATDPPTLNHRNDPFTPLEIAEAREIQCTLAQCEGNRGRAATALGISRNTLWRKMKRFGL